MSGPKILILVLVVLVVLFAVGAGVGLRKRGRSPGIEKPGWTKLIERVFGGKEAPVQPGEIQLLSRGPGGSVDNKFVVPAGETRFLVRGSERTVRKLKLAVAGDGEADVIWDPRGAGAVKLEVPMRPNKPATEFRVQKEGGLLAFKMKRSAIGSAPPVVHVELK